MSDTHTAGTVRPRRTRPMLVAAAVVAIAVAGRTRFGRPVCLSQFDGQVTIINLWGSWCAPCLSETASLNSSYQSVKSAGVAFLGIDIRDSVTGAAAVNQPYPSIFDPNGVTLQSVRGLPTGSVPLTVVLDGRHRVAQVWLREITRDELTTVVRALLAED